MFNNIGGFDRFVRMILGLAIRSLVRFGPETAWGYLGLVPFLTGVFGWCPLYALLGISTNPKAPARSASS